MLKVDLKDKHISEAYDALVEAVNAKRKRAVNEAAKNAAKWHLKQAAHYVSLAGDELNLHDLIKNEGDNQ